MPKRLNTEDVKAIFERYGYTVPDNFVYQNNSTSIRVYDEQENTYKDMTYKKLQYQIKKGRSEMEGDPFFLNMALSETGPRTRDGFIDMMNMALSETGPRTREGFYDLINTPLSDEELPRSQLERYEKRFGKNFMRETEETKNNVMQLANEIIKKLIKKQSFSLSPKGENGVHSIVDFLYALSHAMKIAVPRIDKNIIMTILDNKGHTQYARVNQNTIDMLDWVLEDKQY